MINVTFDMSFNFPNFLKGIYRGAFRLYNDDDDHILSGIAESELF